MNENGTSFMLEAEQSTAASTPVRRALSSAEKNHPTEREISARHSVGRIARNAQTLIVAASFTAGAVGMAALGDEFGSHVQPERGSPACAQAASGGCPEGEGSVFKYKYEDNSRDGRVSINEWMIDEEKEVELKPDGLAPPKTIYFRYRDSEISFRFSTYRDKPEELSDTLIVLLGYGLKHAELSSKQAEISTDRICEISENIERALLAWPASSRVMNYPPTYLNKKIPFRQVKIMMAGWEGSVQ